MPQPSIRHLLIALLLVLTPFAARASEGEDLYRKGQYAEAMTWWTAAAEKGDVEAARRLGVEYMDGKRGVVERDVGKARRYHLQAAMAGDPRSMLDLGTIHENGYGVPESLEEAARWYLWGAKYGLGTAQYNIALMLESGEGGRQDLVEAYMWQALGAQDGWKTMPEAKFDLRNPPADTAMGLLAPKLTTAQRAEALARAKAFRT